MDLFFVWLFGYFTLIAYGKISPRRSKNAGAYDRQVGKYDEDLFGWKKRMTRWLGPLLILFFLARLFFEVLELVNAR
jgi:hypothetical protein